MNPPSFSPGAAPATVAARLDQTLIREQDFRIRQQADYRACEWALSDADWDKLMDRSPQGTVFSESVWLRAIDAPYARFGCFKGERLVGAALVFPVSSASGECGPVELTPFAGLFFDEHPGEPASTALSHRKNATLSLLGALEERYARLYLNNHYTVRDLRPFQWHLFGQQAEYRLTINYTYTLALVDLAEAWRGLEKETRNAIQRARRAGVRVDQEADFGVFLRLRERTFARQGLTPDTSAERAASVFVALRNAGRAQLFVARRPDGQPSSGVVIIKDSKRAYYLFGASDPDLRSDASASLALWSAIEDVAQSVTELDLVGCNSPDRDRFKRGFGGQLRDYFIVEGPTW